MAVVVLKAFVVLTTLALEAFLGKKPWNLNFFKELKSKKKTNTKLGF
jgi:hypothetical protein